MMTKKLYLLLLALLPLMGYCQVDKVYDTVEQMPSFPGGMSKLFDYLKKNVQYPAQEQAQLRGRVIVTFVVGKDGTIGDATVVKGLSPLIDAEAKRVVLAMPKWQPGRNNGSPVRVKYTIPLTFDSSNRAPARQDQQLASNTKQAGTAPVTEKKTESPVTEKKTETASSNLQKSVNGISKVFRFLMYKRKEMVERKENYCVYVISINDTKGTTPSITFASYEKQNPKIKKSETKVDLYGSVVFDFSTMDKDSTTIKFLDKNDLLYSFSARGEGDDLLLQLEVYDMSNDQERLIEEYLSIGEEDDDNTKMWGILMNNVLKDSFNLYELPNDEAYKLLFVDDEDVDNYISVRLNDYEGTLPYIKIKYLKWDTRKTIKEYGFPLNPSYSYSLDDDVVTFFSADGKYSFAFSNDDEQVNFYGIENSIQKIIIRGSVRIDPNNEQCVKTDENYTTMKGTAIVEDFNLYEHVE